MKKVLALVLALTMVLGFAATASAAYLDFGFDLFPHDGVTYEVDGFTDTEFDVEGNKEYKITATFTDDHLNASYAVDNGLYDSLYADLQVLNIIDSYYAYNGNHSWTYGLANGGATNVADFNNNPMTKAIRAAGLTGATLWNTFCLELQATATPTFEDVYEDSAAFRSAVRELRNSPYYLDYTNSIYGLAKGIVATASSSDSTYATVTSQPTIDIDRDIAKDETTYTVEFKVRFTNTTFRTADVDIDVNYSAAGSTQSNRYTHKDTLSFTVFQARRGAPAGNSRTGIDRE